MIRVYSLRADPQLREVQEMSLKAVPHGIAPEPALVGTEDWWKAIDEGTLESRVFEGEITRAKWSSMGDWPSFEAKNASGEVRTFTRMVDPTRYAPGLRVRVHTVIVPLKRKVPGKETRELVTEIWLQESSLRVSSKPIGPEGMFGQQK